MSEIKVNKISPRAACGTVQLGDSGDTFTIPAGASITNSGTASGFGATGSASWNTTVKTGDFTAVAGEGYFVNTTSGEIDVTLPAGSPGAVVAVKDYAKTWGSNNCIIISNGSEKIGGSTSNAILSTPGLAVTFIYIDSTQGWLVTDDGNQSVAVTDPFIIATGGTETTSGDFKIHTFTGPGTFSVSNTAVVAANNQIDYLVLAGGGAGGGPLGLDSAGSGGGGAGGFRLSNDTCMPAPLTSPLANPTGLTATVASFPITVGAGGTPNGNPPGAGGNGSNSIFSSITSTGGGGGGSHPGAPIPLQSGQAGGSGGGAGRSSTPTPPSSGGTGNTPPVSPPQGNNGGAGDQGAPAYGQGGGGGAGAAGSVAQAASPTAGGSGGIGSFVVQSGFAGCNGTPGPVGSTRYFAGGGGGATYQGGTKGPGGAGGGGESNFSPNNPSSPGISAVSGGVNTGGGGGGMTQQGTGGAGGSGIVIIRYKFQ